MSELFRLADRLQGVENSPTVRLNGIAMEMIRAGKDVINFTVGETDFETPEPVCRAAVQAINSGKTKYTPPHGVPELRSAAAEWFLREFQLRYVPSQITTTAGVKQGVFHLILATISPGDEVLIPSPYWVSYPEMVRIAGGVPVILPVGARFSLDPELVRKFLTPKTRMIVLNSPNNPSGGMYSREEMACLARLLEGTRVLVASDEIYSSLSYGEVPFVSFASISEDAYRRTISFNGLSKSHAMTGWRIGFAAGELSIIEAMGILQAQSSTHVTSFVQQAAIEALRPGVVDFSPRLAEMKLRRELTIRKFRQIPHLSFQEPQGAFYLFPDFSFYMKKLGGGSVELAEYLLNQAGVALVPGKPFGDDRCIRFSFAKNLKVLEAGIDRIHAALQKISG